MAPMARPLAAISIVALMLGSVAPHAAAAAEPALAPTPNTSIVIYKPPAGGKPGIAVTGTLAGGAFTKKGSFRTGRWSDIVVGRDSMALYDKKSGRLLSGRFRDGVWKPVRSRTMKKGFSHVAASCDSILFYRRASREVVTGELTSGQVRDLRRVSGDSILVSYQFTHVEASCDTVLFHATYPATNASPETTVRRAGTLDDGLYDPLAYNFYGDFRRNRLAANRDSFLDLDVPSSGLAAAGWGRLKDGLWTPVSSGSGWPRWDIIAGASDTLLLYQRSDGAAARIILEDGALTDLGPFGTKLRKGARIIAGGK